MMSLSTSFSHQNFFSLTWATKSLSWTIPGMLDQESKIVAAHVDSSESDWHGRGTVSLPLENTHSTTSVEATVQKFQYWHPKHKETYLVLIDDHEPLAPEDTFSIWWLTSNQVGLGWRVHLADVGWIYEKWITCRCRCGWHGGSS
jgi:hypothetical protein